MDEEITETAEKNLKDLEKVINFVISEHPFAEDIFLQIKFLEKLQDEVDGMYGHYPCTEDFKCEFSDHQKIVSESFDKFIEHLKRELGVILEDLFIQRKIFRKDKNAQESIS